MRIALSTALQKLSRKIAEGAKVELKLQLPSKPNIAEGQEPTVEQKRQLAAFSRAEQIQLELHYSKSEVDLDEHREELQKALPPPVNDGNESSSVSAMK